MKTTSILPLLCASIATWASAWATASAPEAGTYAASIFVTNTSGTSCLDTEGYQYAGEVSFPGLSGSPDYVRIPLTGYGVAVSSVQTLTISSGKGTTHPSGKFTWTGNGVGLSWSQSGTFKTAITEVGTHTFVMQISEAYSGCTEDLNVSLVRIGANQ